jgi:hypothetical protein
MSQFDFGGSFDDEFEGINHPTWTENEWISFLDTARKEVRLFLNAYMKHKESEDRLEVAFSEMGWLTSQVLEELEDSEREALDRLMSALNEGRIDGLNEAEIVGEQEVESLSYYRQPIFVAMEALGMYLTYVWEWFMDSCPCAIPVRLAWEYGKFIGDIRVQATQAVVAMDAEEFALAVCHLKRGLSALNPLMERINTVERIQNKAAKTFAAEARRVAFDLRELLLRCMQIARSL